MMLARVRPRRVITLLGVLCILIATGRPGAAAPGDLDPTFDVDGKVTTDISGSSDVARATAIQGGGKIVTTGYALVSGTNDFALSRYNTDGSLDPTFDGDGRMTTDFAGSSDQAFAMAIQGDGKIVAAGSASISGVDFALARYNPDGSLDSTFDGDGKVTTDYGFGSSEIHGLAIQTDGKIVAAGLGRATGTDFFLARYNTNGSLDTSFDGDGKVTFLGFGSDDNRANAVAIQADGRIVAAGCTSCASSAGNFALARFNINGSLDFTFDGDGKAITDFLSDDDQAHAITLQVDGKIVAVGGATHSSGVSLFALARYNTDGSLDTAFDGDGKVTTAVGAEDEARGVAIQTDRKIVAAGLACAFCFAGGEFGLARYNPDGSLDTTFSGDGKVMTDFGFANDKAFAVAIQTDGKIVAAGVADGDFALARYKICRVTSRRSSIPCR